MTKAPLAGRRIALTRPAASSADWRARLETLGAEVVELPLISVSKDVNLHTLNEVFQELGGYEWIIFTSVNGVRYFFEEFHRVYDDIRAFGLMRIAVVGEATAAAVREQHLRVELQPKKANAEELAKALIEREGMDSAKVLVITGNKNREIPRPEARGGPRHRGHPARLQDRGDRPGQGPGPPAISAPRVPTRSCSRARRPRSPSSTRRRRSSSRPRPGVRSPAALARARPPR